MATRTHLPVILLHVLALEAKTEFPQPELVQPLRSAFTASGKITPMDHDVAAKTKQNWNSSDTKGRTLGMGITVHLGDAPKLDWMLSQPEAKLIEGFRQESTDGINGSMSFAEIAVRRFGGILAMPSAGLFAIAEGFSNGDVLGVSKYSFPNYGDVLRVLVKHKKLPRKGELAFIYLLAAEYGFIDGVEQLGPLVHSAQNHSMALVLCFYRQYWSRALPQSLLRSHAPYVASVLQTWLGLEVPGGTSIIEDKRPLSEVESLEVVRTAQQPLVVRFAKYFVARGADVNFAIWDLNALKLACLQDMPDVVKVLLKAKADPMLPQIAGGRTALHVAVLSRSMRVLRVLIADKKKAGTMLAARDISNRTAAEMAHAVGFVDGAEFLGAASAKHDTAGICKPDTAMSKFIGAQFHVNSTPALPHLLEGWHSVVSDSPFGSICEIPSIRIEELTQQRIVEALIMRVPLRIEGGAKSDALHSWSKDYLVANAGATRVNPTSTPYAGHYGKGEEKIEMSLKEFIERMPTSSKREKAQNLRAIFQEVKANDTNWAPMLKMIRKDVPRFDTVFAKASLAAGQHIGTLTVRPNDVQFGLGPLGSGVSLHHHGHAYASLFHGRKRWAFVFPPRQVLSNRLASWHFARWDARLSQETARSSSRRQQEVRFCLQEGGDAILVPEDVSHATQNLALSLGVVQEFNADFSKIAPS